MSKFILYNPTKYVVPVMIKTKTGLSQVNIFPNDSLEINQDQVTDSVVNLTTPSRKVLILKEVK